MKKGEFPKTRSYTQIKKFCVYGLVCPLELRVKYIGCTTNMRMREGAHNAIPNILIMNLKHKWIFELKKLGLSPLVLIINQYDTKVEAITNERFLIKKHARTICNTQILYTKYPAPKKQPKNSVEIISNDALIYDDMNYKKSVNYTPLDKYPITLNYTEDTNSIKYILYCDSSDTITIAKKEKFIYVFAKNTNSNYFKVQVFNTEKKKEKGSVFFNSSDMETKENPCFKIINRDIAHQIEIASCYIL